MSPKFSDVLPLHTDGTCDLVLARTVWQRWREVTCLIEHVIGKGNKIVCPLTVSFYLLIKIHFKIFTRVYSVL